MADCVSKTNTTQTQMISGVPASFVLDMDSVQEVLGATFAEVVQNVAILRVSQSYLNLCADMDTQSELRLKSTHQQTRVPHELEKAESGLNVLCAAYVQAKQSENESVQKDIQKAIFSLSEVYQKKVSEAYFSASNIVFDATELADKQALLKQLVAWRNALQQVHFSWPAEKESMNMSLFNEKVEHYGRQLGIDGQVFPEKRSSFTTILPRSFAGHSRCA